MARYVLALTSILLGTLYLFVALTQLPTLMLALNGGIPVRDALLLFAETPLLMMRFGDALPTFLFFTSVILSGLYIFLLFVRAARMRAAHLRYGLSGSLMSVVSIGCIACGSLLSPLMVLLGAGIPLSYFGRFDLALGIFGNLLLALGIVLLIRIPHGAH